MPDMRLVKKGRGQPRAALAEQGKASVALAEKYAADLARKKWTAEKTNDLKAKVNELETEAAEKAEAFEGSVNAAGAKEEAIDAAKNFIRELDLALPECLRETTIEGVTISAFEKGESLGRSSKRISAYLTKIRRS